MKKLLTVVILITILVSTKLLLKGDDNFEDGPQSEQSRIASKTEDDDCLALDEFLENYPDATPEEIYEVEECNRERAAKLGLDKRNTGFLGNRNQ